MAGDALSAFHDQLLTEVRAYVDKALAAANTKTVQTAVDRAMGRPQPAPTVNVAAPHVAVTPDVNINVPSAEIELGDTVVNMDMAALAGEMSAIKTLLAQILAELGKPVTKVVHREGQFISSVTETRG